MAFRDTFEELHPELHWGFQSITSAIMLLVGSNPFEEKYAIKFSWKQHNQDFELVIKYKEKNERGFKN